MRKVNLYCVGNLKDKEFISMCDEYKKRISKFAEINVIELKEVTNLDSVEKTLQKEEFMLCEKVNLNQTFVFDVKGSQYTSEDFAEVIDKYFLTNSTLNFVIGSSHGLSKNIKESCAKKISFSKMTLPHRLFRVVALEQIYRAFCINNNISYHK